MARMRIALGTGWFFPESVGGTEVYVAELARELRAAGHEVEVGTATTGSESGWFEHEGLRCFRWSVAGEVSWRVLRGLEDPPGLAEFRQWLDEGKFDVYHQHSVTMGCGHWHINTAFELAVPCFLTVHMPDALCLRGTLLEAGRAVCDGRVEAERCIRCTVPQPWATAALAVARGVSRMWWEKASGKAGSLLGKREQVAGLVEWMRHSVAYCRRVVLVSEWLREVFKRNRLDWGKLVVSRQGVSRDFLSGCAIDGRGIGVVDATSDQEKKKSVLHARGIPERLSAERPLVVGYVGRFTWIKGVDVLVEAVRRLPASCAVRLVLAGPQPRDAADAEYLRSLQERAAGDERIVFREAVLRGELAKFYRSVDVVAVPSRCLETGPLVALEALACGTPVLGTARGGLKECFAPELHAAALVEEPEPAMWAERLQTLAEETERLRQLRQAVAALPVRTMAEVAREMEELYARHRG
jgi:glycosyltransferase involved in cell wall biosynthesis